MNRSRMKMETKTEERPLKEIDVDELRLRLETVLSRLDVLFKEIGPRLTEVGNLRGEAALVYRELVVRGVLKEGQDVDRRPAAGTLSTT